MPNPAVPRVLQNRLVLALTAAAALAFAVPAAAAAAPPPAVLTVKTASVGAAGNPAVGIVPFTDAIYRSCAEAPEAKPACQQVGAVKYRYGIGQLEVTVDQWVDFLNTADPSGRNRHRLYSSTESPSAWPQYGQIEFSSGAGKGRHYAVASPEWADKPYAFANFLHTARFVNSLYNGQLLAKRTSAEGAFRYVTYRVRLSRQTERGMYDMTRPATTRNHRSGFVVPSQNEWIKAAYYDPSGGGTYSYWKYPTNPGVFGSETDAPSATVLDPATGAVTNASTQPLATFKGGATAPTWCPAAVGTEACTTVNPFDLDPTAYAKVYQGNVSTVGQAKTLGPWGTLDQGGNVVEWTDTITPPPSGRSGGRVWRRLHGGIANSTVYQLWLSAVGLQPQDNAFFTATYPWLGIRVGVVGDLEIGAGRK